jgi:heterodisulfide reductase subunit C
MDITPRQIMRSIQLGLKEEVLDSSAIWLCLACETCTLRCPREIDIARVMESLRHQCLLEGRSPAQKDVVKFYDAFLQQVRFFGRVYEVGLGVAYNLRSMHILNNATRLPTWFAKGKVKLAPHRTKGASEVRRIAARAKELERKHT